MAMSHQMMLGCPACGMVRHPSMFGLRYNGEEFVQADELPTHEVRVMLRHIGGRNSAHWDRLPLTSDAVRGLRIHFQRVVQQLTAILIESGEETEEEQEKEAEAEPNQDQGF